MKSLIQKTKFLDSNVKLSERLFYVFHGRGNVVECKLEGENFQRIFSAFKEKYEPKLVEVKVDRRWHPSLNIDEFKLVEEIDPKPWKVENKKRFEASNPAFGTADIQFMH